MHTLTCIYFFKVLAKLENHLTDVRKIKDKVKKKKLLLMAKENPILNEEESPVYDGDSTSDDELIEYKQFKKLVLVGDPVKLREGADDNDPDWLMDEAYVMVMKKEKLLEKCGKRT